MITGGIGDAGGVAERLGVEEGACVGEGPGALRSGDDGDGCGAKEGGAVVDEQGFTGGECRTSGCSPEGSREEE